MSLIKCNECKKEISDTTKSCIYCGCPLGKATFFTEMNGVVIEDEKGNILIKMKAGEKYEISINVDTKLYIWLNWAFRKNKKIEVLVDANEVSNFLIEFADLMCSKIRAVKIN